MSSSFPTGKKCNSLVCKYLQSNSNSPFLWQYYFLSHNLIYSFEFFVVPKVHSVLSQPHHPHSSLLWCHPPHLRAWLSTLPDQNKHYFLLKKKNSQLFLFCFTLFLELILAYALSLSHSIHERGPG